MDIDPNLMQTFLEESEENLTLAEQNMLSLEQGEIAHKEAIATVFRAIHSFKGGASFFNLNKMVNLLHVTENLLSKMQHDKIKGTAEIYHLVIEAIDLSRQMLFAEDYGESTPIEEISKRITNFEKGEEGSKNVNTGLHFFDDNPSPNPETVIEKKSEKTEEKNIKEIKKKPIANGNKKVKNKNISNSSTIRVRTDLIDNILDQVGEVILVRNQLAKKYPSEDIVSSLSQRIGKLHNSILQTRMQSVSILFDKFHRIVRDLSQQLEKNILLSIDAGDVELDRSILESFSDPLTHLVRNAADHGLESTDDRIAKGKSSQGNLRLKATQTGGKVEITVQDDGAGINTEIIKQKAINKGLITEIKASELSEAQILELIMLPGFSTRDEASEISGRGVGMDVVKTSIEAAGGTLNISTAIEKGSTFTASFPLTLAIATAIIVRTGKHRFVIPEILVDEISSIRWSERDETLQKTDNRLYFKHRGQLIPTIILEEFLGGNPAEVFDKFAYKNVVLCQHQGSPFCIIVDDILSIEDISVKGMPLLLSGYLYFSGLTVLENGEVSMLLDIPKIGNKLLKEVASGVIESHKRSQFNQMAESRKEQIIIFDNHPEEQFGIHIDFISEITSVADEKIKKLGNTEYVELHGAHMPIIRIEDFLNVTPPPKRENHLVFVSSTSFPIGILGRKAIKVKTVGEDMNSNLANTDGVLATIVDKHNMVTILDMFTLFRKRSPEHFKGIKQLGEGKKVLLVEDTKFFLVLLTQYLTEGGFEVIKARNGFEALDILSSEEDSIDAIVSDIIMPGLGGIELIEKIRRSTSQKLREIPCLAVTAISDDEQLFAVKEAGFDSCIRKNEKAVMLEKLHHLVKYGRTNLNLKKVS